MENKNFILKEKKAAIINLGCKVNKYESDAMADKLKSAGMRIVEPEETADVYIVNTCSVTNMAQKKSRQMLRRAKKRNPEAVIIAAGCYVNAEHDVLQQEKFIDIVVGNNRKKDIVHVLTQYFEQTQNPLVSDEIPLVSDNIHTDFYLDISHTKEYEEMGSIDVSAMNHRRAYIKIQDGCNQFCSYCIIPYTRGRVRSRKPENILAEIEKLAAEGVKEFVLTGIHISSYGVDFKKENAEYDEAIRHTEPDITGESADSIETFETRIMNLGDLIKAIEQLPQVQRIRLGSLEPRIITEEFLEKIGKSDKLCPHFHLSLQSACNDTLKRMNRKYTIEEFAEKCRLLRKQFDEPAITTDVIVGFPGETEEEFATTLSNLETLNLYEIHVFKYSVRSGTVAEKLPAQVSESVKGKRSDVLLELTARQKEAYENKLSGYVDEVLVEEQLESGDTEETGHISKTAGLKEAMLLDENYYGARICSNSAGDIEKNQVAQKYFTGHTKRYVKVKIAGNDNIINQIVKVKLV